MSSSDPNSKIDILDSTENVANKLKKAVCTPKVCEENGVIAFVEYVLFPVAQLAGHGKFIVEKDGKDIEYTNIADLKKDYTADTVCKLHPFLRLLSSFSICSCAHTTCLLICVSL